MGDQEVGVAGEGAARRRGGRVLVADVGGGDNGDCFGLFQVRRPYHCWGECRIARRFTAFNADYYGGIIRAYYDGRMGWLNTVERGRQYRAGDLWGTVGAWFAGRWWTDPAASYIGVVKQRLRERTWRRDYFRGG